MNNGSKLGRVKLSGKLSAKPGDSLPSTALLSTEGRKIDLRAEATKHPIVIFFYPGDGAGNQYPELSGCTLESRTIRDNLSAFNQIGVAVFGVSLQPSEHQNEFVKREKLNFTLLSDSDQQLTSVLGVPTWRSDEDETYVSRNTIIVGKGGKITQVFPDVSVEGHVEAVIAAYKAS